MDVFVRAYRDVFTATRKKDADLIGGYVHKIIY